MTEAQGLAFAEQSSLRCAAVIPVRNRPLLVVDAIASVQRQTHPLDEIIVVDDGSTDATPDVIARLSKQDGRIRLVALPKNGGASAARNVGVDASNCDWTCFLDSDDQWMAHKHELQLRALANAPTAVASFSGIRYHSRVRTRDRSPPREITLQALRRFNHLGSTSAAMVRRDVLQQVGGFDPGLPSCQDWDLWIRLRRAGEFAIVPEALVVFNLTESVRISRNKVGVLAGHAQVFARALEDVADARERRVVTAHHLLRLTQVHYYDFEERGTAAATALKSLMLYPTRQAAMLFAKAASRKSLAVLLGQVRAESVEGFLRRRVRVR